MAQLNVLLTQAATLIIWAWFTILREVPLNARMIKADGSGDTLKAGFHSRRTWVRGIWWFVLCVAGAAAAGLLIGWERIGWAWAALAVLLAGFFFRTFGPLLSVAMKLPYKKRFYASPKSMSFPDKQVWAYVRKRNPGVADEALQEVADEANHYLLNYVGLGCLLVYAACTARLLWPS